MKVTGRKNGLTRELYEDLDSNDTGGTVFLSTDKPIYQPGQTFNVRGLYFGVDGTVVTDSELDFTIKDEDETVLYRETVKTSAFGIASISWKIPDGAKLGYYSVEVDADDDLLANRTEFRVSRYDLPNFSVTAAPDKTFYLPADRHAEITVNAMYLFGKPVTKGKVRVVQESERRWNYKAQKYDVEEKQTFEGETDAEGKYVAKVDLSEAMADLQDSGWKRFEDLRFAAYFTDTTTNRTEQRRFDIRLTKEAIHVYVVGNRYEQHQDLPVSAYVSAFYADGKPAVCDVEVKGYKIYGDAETARTLQRLKTNSLGAGRLEFFRPKFESPDDDLTVRITARDRGGQIGTLEERINFDDEHRLKVGVEKTIYKPGESVKINVLSSRKEGFVYVDVVAPNWSVLESRLVKLTNGKADVKIPYNQNFKGELIVAAYSDEESGYYSSEERDSRGIIYPAKQNLRLDAQFSSAIYKPNEEGKINFSVSDANGSAVQSALGVVIFDKAIEERARTDEDFGGGYFSQFGNLLGYEKSFGRISLRDLNELDPSKSVSSEMQLAAEVMLATSYYQARIYRSRRDETEAKNVYAEFFKKQLAPLEKALKDQYEKNYAHPVDQSSLQKILSENGMDFGALRDPWGQNYYALFTVEKAQSIITLRTAGADKRSGTPDDFNVSSASFAYFAPLGKTIDDVVRDYHKRTGKYIFDRPTLLAELAKQNFDLDKLNDRWNRFYRIDFKVVGRKYVIAVDSYGANGIYQPNDWNSDDFEIWKSEIDYFTETENWINKIFSEAKGAGKKFLPQNELEFKQFLKEKGVDFDEIRDGFGEPVYLAWNSFSRRENKTRIEDGKQANLPVMEKIGVFIIRSKGADRIVSADDFDLASVSGVVSEQSEDAAFTKSSIRTITFSGANGAIQGTVLDMNGAVIPGATVTATDEEDETKTYSVTTNEEGVFLLENLPSAKYKVTVSSPNFKSSVYFNIQVRAQNLVEMKVTLEAGNVTTTVTVSSDASVTIDTSDTKIETNITQSPIEALPVGTQFSSFLKIAPKQNAVTEREENSTPRLREYFPETLLWQPEIITDADGKAEIKFKLADNITTWKLYTIASTKNGKIGVAEKEITAFQPFFVDLDPPKFLTLGDEISLPVQVRNYTESKQKVKVAMESADWFSFLNTANRQIEVDAGATENAIFDFKASAVIKGGKQRVMAIAPKDSDAIEKPVTVKPNGREIVKTESRLFRESAAFDINFPAYALPKTQRAELKIYPNLLSHVAESVEGLLQRPYGCGEQTTSSTYPNLMILKFTKGDTRLRQTAQKYLQRGYERLLGYQVEGGGFSYWGGKDEPNVALTAYVLRFLNDARGFVGVDEEVIKKAQTWLVSQQKPDGSWTKKYYWENSEDTRRTRRFTAYVARILAMSKDTDKAVLQKALAFLKARTAEITEPYELALYGLASLDAGNVETARAIAQKLETMQVAEGNSVYWKLDGSTPFYGWGNAGQIETTALAVQFLTREANTVQIENAERSALISKATLYLLKAKDRYGVWYSTQTTINVLDAFLATIGQAPKGENQSLQILLNGASVQNVSIAPDKIEPVILDLTEKLGPTANRLEIKSSAASPVMAQVVAAHYIEWQNAESANGSDFVRLDYKCDKNAARIMEEITCAVEAEKTGSNSYGMLLAEIGLPPGADVSRESLEKAMEADWSLSRYDVLPDRIILYMWSKQGGTKFNFKFHPRYGINAQTPASIVYDYYNEEAKATIAPLKFEVK